MANTTDNNGGNHSNVSLFLWMW